MKYDFCRVKKQVLAESDLYNYFSPYRLFSFLINEIFRNDIDSIKEFMLSEAGGFELQEVNKVVLHHQLNNKSSKYKIELS